MPMTYEEYLKSHGATDEDIKVLSTPVARKAWEAQQKAIADANAARDREIAEHNKTRADDKAWYDNDILPNYQKMEADAALARAEADRAKSVIKTMAGRDATLAQIAKDMGYDAATPTTPTTPTTPAFDATKYIDKDTFLAAVDREGDAIAAAQDIAAEHASLFPGQRLNFRDLRKEAQQRRISVEALWQEKYKVPEARAAQAAAIKAADEDRIRKEEREKVTREYADRYGDPNARPLVPSTSPFTMRKPDVDASRAGKQPWEIGEKALERSRVEKGVGAVLKQVQ